ncbi:MAG: ABC transporter substrate-binding protein [Hyphomicrobiales bacterium]|nr:ABC transporter substrate-binding protein [Hyphomicrobiales bacterium]
MKNALRASRLALAFALTFACAPAFAQKAYGPGVSDTEIKFGNTMPYSGPASSLGTVGKIMSAYFAMINEKGGVNGRKLNMISLDDGFAPPKTVEAVKRMVEDDQVAFIYGTMGTAPSSAVAKYLNVNKVPQIFAISSASKWNDPKGMPWSVALNWAPIYMTEAGIDIRYALKANPNAKFAVLYQNDDSGKDYMRGINETFAKDPDRLVKAMSFEVTDPTVDSQVVTLAATKADVFLIYSVTPRACAQAIRKAWELGWRPQRFLSSGCANIDTILKPAGLDASKDIMTLASIKPLDLSKKDPDLEAYVDFIKTRTPGVDPNYSSGEYAYFSAASLVELLKRCGDNLTRENIMKQATNLTQVPAPLLMPGIKLDTSPDDFTPLHDGYLMRFDGEKFEVVGDMMKGK